MAEPLPDGYWTTSTFTGSNIEIIAGRAEDSQINRFGGRPGSTPGTEKGAMRYVLTSCVAFAAMTAAALAEPSAPTRLSESQLDTITAGLNIDTPNFAIQTGCSSCEVSHFRPTLIPGLITQGDGNAIDANSNGWAVGYNGPLGILGGGAGSGRGSGYSGGGGGVYDDSAISFGPDAFGAGGAFEGGTGGGFGYRGPLGLFQFAVGAGEGKSAYSGALAGTYAPLSVNNVGGTISVPTGGGNSASLTVMTAFRAPGS